MSSKKPYVPRESETFFFLCGVSGARLKDGLCPEHKSLECVAKYSLDHAFDAQLVEAARSVHPRRDDLQIVVQLNGQPTEQELCSGLVPLDRSKCMCGLDIDETAATILYELTERYPSEEDPSEED